MTKAEREAVEAIMRTGIQLSNVAFNLKRSQALPPDARETLASLQEQWDKHSFAMRAILDPPKRKRAKR